MLTTPDQLLFKLKLYFFLFYKTIYLNELSLSVRVSYCSTYPSTYIIKLFTDVIVGDVIVGDVIVGES